MKAQEDILTAQTCSSLTRFQNNLAVDPTTKDWKEWNFILFPPTRKKICTSGSGFKLNLRQCPKEQQKTWATQFLKMERRMSNIGAISARNWKIIAPRTGCMSHQLMKLKCVMITGDSLSVPMKMAQTLIFQPTIEETASPFQPIVPCLDQGGCPFDQLVNHSHTQ